MSDKKIWFGIPNSHMQWVPAPAAGMQREYSSYYESINLQDGRRKSRRSAQSTSKFSMNFFGEAQGLQGIEVFNKFATGFYGEGLKYFADPYAYGQNLMPPEWASPALIDAGWRTIYDSAGVLLQPAMTATAANSYSQPPLTATFAGAGLGIAVLPDRKATIAIPPTHTLHLGVSGTSSGNVFVRYRGVVGDGTYGTATSLTLLSPTGATRMNATISGASFVAVEIYIYRTLPGASSVSIASSMAQLWPTGVTPVLTGSHQSGMGHRGLEFADSAIVETYEYAFPPMKGLSTSLEEIG